jgi:hypothetical protein
LLAALLFGAPAVGADLTRGALLGDRFRDEIEAGDVHSYLLPLVGNSTLFLEFDSDTDDGPEPEVVVLDGAGNEKARRRGKEFELEIPVEFPGTWRIEVHAGAYEGDYELELDADLPKKTVVNTTSVDGEPAVVRLDVPPATFVEIEIERRSGAGPEVLSVKDWAGRDIGFAYRKKTKKRVKLEPVPVTAPGGLFLRIQGIDGAPGSWEVEAKTKRDHEEVPEDGVHESTSRRIILQITPGTDPQAIADILGYEMIKARNGYIVLETPEGREGFEEEDAREAEALLGEVIWGEADLNAQTPEGSQSNGVAVGSTFGESDFQNQVAFEIVRAGRAHERATGAGVIVAVLDSGIDALHPLFLDRLVPGHDYVGNDDDPAEEANGIDDDGDGTIDEGFGHGTFVAGMIVGAAPDVRIMPVRVLDDEGRGEVSNIAAGIHFAIDHGAQVVNLSLGMSVRSEVLRGAVLLAISHGVTVVASTGNRGAQGGIDYPSGVTGVVAVTALDGERRMAPFANVGGRTALAAPGTELLGPYPGNRSATWSGTSFATALASGGAAILLERKPVNPAKVNRLMRKKARSVQGIPRAERKLLGGGRLDLKKLAKKTKR